MRTFAIVLSMSWFALSAAAQEPTSLPARTQELEQLTKLYARAQRALGGEHVTLTATVYLGKQDPDATRLSAGVAGLVSVPLFGVGGGHGADWYPVLATDDASAALRRFEREVAGYAQLVEGVEETNAPYDALLSAAKVLGRELDDADAAFWKPARGLKLCLDDLNVITDALRAGQPVPDAAEFARWYADEGEASLQKLSQACGALLAEARDAKASLTRLRELVQSYLAAAREGALELGRHNLLLGPTLGIPFVDDPTDWVLAGGLLELGAGKYVRLSLSGGVQLAYRDPLRTPGWFAGIALSGELGDDLFHLLNGGLAAGRSVSSAP